MQEAYDTLKQRFDEGAYALLKKELNVKYDPSRRELLRLYENDDWYELHREYQSVAASLDLKDRKDNSEEWQHFETILNEMSKHPYILRFSQDVQTNRHAFLSQALLKMK